MKPEEIRAFPVQGQMHGDKLGGQLHHGMTLLDYFAAAAMSGMLSDPNCCGGFASVAEYSYKYADAMLAERSKFIGRPDKKQASSESLNEKVLKWLFVGSVGASSKAMACAAVGLRVQGGGHYPLDADDFSRCAAFLHDVPEARQHFAMIADMNPVWKVMIENWEELEGLFNNGWVERLNRRLQEIRGNSF